MNDCKTLSSEPVYFEHETHTLQRGVGFLLPLNNPLAIPTPIRTIRHLSNPFGLSPHSSSDLILCLFI